MVRPFTNPWRSHFRIRSTSWWLAFQNFRYIRGYEILRPFRSWKNVSCFSTSVWQIIVSYFLCFLYGFFKWMQKRFPKLIFPPWLLAYKRPEIYRSSSWVLYSACKEPRDIVRSLTRTKIKSGTYSLNNYWTWHWHKNFYVIVCQLHVCSKQFFNWKSLKILKPACWVFFFFVFLQKKSYLKLTLVWFERDKTPIFF